MTSDQAIYYVTMRRGIMHCLMVEPETADTFKPSDGAGNPAELIAGPLTHDQWQPFLREYEIGHYAILVDYHRSGPYLGEQEIDWKVRYGARPSGYAFACGPFETEEAAIAAKAKFAAGLPLTPQEVEIPDYDQETDAEFTFTVEHLFYDPEILDSYPVRPTIDDQFTMPLSKA